MKMLTKVLIPAITILLIMTFAGCSSTGSSEGEYIIGAPDVKSLLSEENTVLVDMQDPSDYSSGHIEGAVNISRSDIMTDTPVSNSLAPRAKIEELLGKKGISNSTRIVIYDITKNMDAARLWWTLKVYGHDNAKVVSGGLNALREAGFNMSTDPTPSAPAAFTASDKNTELIATKQDVLNQVNEPDENVVLLDTRTIEEFNEGTIPGSILIDYADNNFADGTYKPVQHIKIQYIEKKITPDNTVIMYCKTSVRAAQTFLALYNAGYRNLKVYDGAWVEWSSDSSLPIQTPDGKKIAPSISDNS